MSRGAVDTPTHPPIHVNPNIYWGPRSKQPRLEPWNAATCVRWQLLHKRAKGARDAEIPRPAFRHRCRQRILFRNSVSLGPIVHPPHPTVHTSSIHPPHLHCTWQAGALDPSGNLAHWNCPTIIIIHPATGEDSAFVTCRQTANKGKSRRPAKKIPLPFTSDLRTKAIWISVSRPPVFNIYLLGHIYLKFG